jgi:hypothetical protein
MRVDDYGLKLVTYCTLNIDDYLDARNYYEVSQYSEDKFVEMIGRCKANDCVDIAGPDSVWLFGFTKRGELFVVEHCKRIKSFLPSIIAQDEALAYASVFINQLKSAYNSGI